MKDETRFLKGSQLFKGLPDQMIEQVFREGRLRRFGPGDIIFREGDNSFEMYVIRGGVVEIGKAPEDSAPPRVVAYLSTGECFGEMAMITGSPRSATVRVPQSAEVLEIPPESFESLTRDHLFLRRLCEILAFRLERADAKLAGDPVERELRGDLRYFDIATLLQTLVNTEQSGILRIETNDGVRAEIHLARGRITQADYRELKGEDAFYQIFADDLEGRFIFSGGNGESSEPTAAISTRPMNLLLEACRMKDELPRLANELGPAERTFTPLVETLVWTDTPTLETALMIWLKIADGATLATIQDEVPRCRFNTLSIIHRLLDSGLIQ